MIVHTGLFVFDGTLLSVDSLTDTIVAPITGLNRAAVAVIRLSGPRAEEIASQVAVHWPSLMKPRFAHYMRYVTGDDGLAILFEPGKSFTGEQSVELSTHGSRASVNGLIKACLVAGARTANPGEFTYRAFMNGRLDLSQAEGVRDTVDAMTELQLRRANQLRDGQVRQEADEVRDMLIQVLAAIEASTDFSEEIGDIELPANVAVLQAVDSRLDTLISSAENSRILKEGIRVAIVGPPNVGKSSLLNRVLGMDRAIVSSIPGTTRDTIEDSFEYLGYLLTLTDTAGIRQTTDEIETLGISRTEDTMMVADVIWLVQDLSTIEAPNHTSFCNSQLLESDGTSLGAKVIQVGNKLDLAVRALESGSNVSAVTGDGIDSLLDQTIRVALPLSFDATMVDPRHVAPLTQTQNAVIDAISTLSSEVPADLAAVQLRQALRHLGEVTGDTATADIIDRVFSDFCIGK